MTRSRRVILFAVGGLAGLLVVVAVALFFLVVRSVDKARLETTASDALGMQVGIGGRVRLGFFPVLLVTLEDVHVHNRGVEVASAKQAVLGIDLLPLLENEVRIDKFALKTARITVARDSDGRFNFDNSEVAAEPLPALDWPDVSLSDGSIVYADKQAGEEFEADDCRVQMPRLTLSAGKRSDLMKDLSFAAELGCGQVRSGGFTLSDLKSSVVANNAVFDLKPVTMRIFGTQGSGSIRADFSGAVPVCELRYVLSQFPIEEFFKAISPKTVATGRMDFSANLSMRGKTMKQMRQTASGQISLGGRNLVLSGTDLDRAFARFESSQNFNLVDVGAFFFAGPLALVVTKGYNFANNFRGTEGSSQIQTLVSNWKVEHGVAQAQDVAMATNENRVALQGGLDFGEDQFKDVTMALIDAKGCAKVRQKIHGSFEAPVVDNPDILTSVAGPALKLLKKGRDLLLGRKCEVFYAGSVAAPKGID